MYERHMGSLMKLITCARPLLGGERPLHDVLASLVDRDAVDMELERRVGRHSVEGLVRLHDPPGKLGVVADAGVRDDRRRHVMPLLAERDVRGQARDSLRDDRLRRRDQHDRLLEPARPRQELFLPCVLRVVAGVRLVGDELDDDVGDHRDVGVDLDVAPQVAAVVVVRRPRLVRDVVVVDGFALRQPEELGRTPRELVREPGDDHGHPVGRNRIVFAPDPVPLLERAVPGQGRVDRLVCRLELGLRRAARRDAVVELDLVLERNLSPPSLRAAVDKPTSCASSHVRRSSSRPSSESRSRTASSSSEPGSRGSSASIRSLISAGP